MKKRKDGRFEGRYSYQGKQKSIYANTEKEVKDKLKKIKAEIELDKYFEPCKMKLSEWLETWLFEYKKKTIKQKTFESYEQIIRCYVNPVLGYKTLDKLNNIDIQKMFNSMTLSPRTIKYTHTVLKAIKGHRFESAFFMAICTGMRRGEILGLKWHDIDFENGLIYVQRTLNRIKVFNNKKIPTWETIETDCKSEKSRRVLPILPELNTRLKTQYTRSKLNKKRKGEILSQNEYVFVNKFGKNINPRNFAKHFYNVLKNNDIGPINFHALRHTYATLALESGIELKVISELLGHSSISFTADTYLHILHHKKIEEISKLKALFEPLESSKIGSF